jgi:polar amino acid transport system permease protein
MGFVTTLWLSFLSLILSFVLGLILALFQRSANMFLQVASRQWIDLIRGTPLLVQILLFYYVVANAFQLENRFLLSVLILSNFSATYISEILRSAWNSIPRSQVEAARAMGFKPIQIFRWVLFPQILKYSLPSLAGQFSSIIKDSSLLSVIAVSELTLNAQEINSVTYSTLESYIPLALAYLCLTLPISLIAKYMERKFHYET